VTERKKTEGIVKDGPLLRASLWKNMEAGRACSNRISARLGILVRKKAVSEAGSKA